MLIIQGRIESLVKRVKNDITRLKKNSMLDFNCMPNISI